ncbi:MAG TPA: hypothetical protein VKB60_09745, partial [Terriglobales bacterium]|nr:hypothetical protein [Terriglobales bacterium]
MTSFSNPQNCMPAVLGRGRAPEISPWPLLATLMAAPLAFGAVQSWAWAAMSIVIVLLALAWAVGRARAASLILFGSPLLIPLIGALGLALVQ